VVRSYEMKSRTTRSAVLLVFVLFGCRQVDGPEASPGDYVAEIEEWRSEREESLRQPDSWLSVVGLFWLEEGDNTFGADPSNDIVFPGTAVPAHAGVFELTEEKVVIRVESGTPVLYEGRQIETLELVSDGAGEPTVLQLGSLSFYVIERAGRFGVRLKDAESEALAAFEGLDYFPVDRAWRIEARFDQYDEPRTLRVPNILGSSTEQSSPGVAVFVIGGREYRLSPIGGPEEELFFVFGDQTNGHETYGGGRFLYPDGPSAAGSLILDFNKAYSPPCVFTAYATCPLPPRENKLASRIDAGEKVYGSGH
jgi:uncharacterized protein (DUF1684 family)